MKICHLVSGIIAITLAVTIVHADEGMWLFNYPPKKLLKEKHGFSPTDAWLAHLQQSAVRLNNGGSGSIPHPHQFLCRERLPVKDDRSSIFGHSSGDASSTAIS